MCAAVRVQSTSKVQHNVCGAPCCSHVCCCLQGMSFLWDAWRHTFPKDLRFCRQCEIFHAQLTSISRRYKDKRTIPRAEVQMILDSYAPVPYRFMQWPLLRIVLFVRMINAVRVYRGERAWLFTRALELEHAKVDKWYQKYAATRSVIDRERYVHDVLEPFHVATTYHRGILVGMLILLQLIIFLTASVFFERLALWWMYYWLDYRSLKAPEPAEGTPGPENATGAPQRSPTREAIIRWWARIIMRHAAPEVLDAYKEILPAPVVELKDGTLAMQVVEMTRKSDGKRVLFIPMPRIAPEGFYHAVGIICRASQGVVLEDVCLEALKTLPPAFYFPLKGEPTFASLGLHHRFYDLLVDDYNVQPPKLFPGSVPASLPTALFVGAMPVAFRYVLFPHMVHGTRTEARIGWGRLKDVLDNPHHPIQSVAMPWSVTQINNLESSLYKLGGWSVTNVSVIPWLRLDDVGSHFCDYFGVP